MRLNSTAKCIFVGYAVFLTVLLVIDDPARAIGGASRAPHFLHVLMPIAHLFSFSLLAILALAARWRMSRGFVVTLLIIYGGATEIAQWFLPPRMAEWQDLAQDIAGILLGAAVFWVAERLNQRYAVSQQRQG